MNLSKILLLGLFLIASGFAIFTSMTTKIDADDPICENAISRFIASWGAGCYYSAYFDEGNSIDIKRLESERDKLETFASKRGVSPEILWYRLKFHQKFRNLFRTNFQVLHYMYLDYLKSQHISLNRQTDYLHFLVQSELVPLAQQTLDDFCDTYILIRREARIEDFAHRLALKKVALSFEYCKSGPH